LTVLDSTDAACQPNGAAQLATIGSPRPPIVASIATTAARAAASVQRLSAAQPAIDQIKTQWATSDIMPAVTISTPHTALPTIVMDDILPSGNMPYLWVESMDLYRICANAPPQTNGLQKKVAMATTNGMTSWPTSLGCGSIRPITDAAPKHDFPAACPKQTHTPFPFTP
jgi:hypothetical protein